MGGGLSLNENRTLAGEGKDKNVSNSKEKPAIPNTSRLFENT